jgi:hypothetical protein
LPAFDQTADQLLAQHCCVRNLHAEEMASWAQVQGQVREAHETEPQAPPVHTPEDRARVDCPLEPARLDQLRPPRQNRSREIRPGRLRTGPHTRWRQATKGRIQDRRVRRVPAASFPGLLPVTSGARAADYQDAPTRAIRSGKATTMDAFPHWLGHRGTARRRRCVGAGNQKKGQGARQRRSGWRSGRRRYCVVNAREVVSGRAGGLLGGGSE